MPLSAKSSSRRSTALAGLRSLVAAIATAAARSDMLPAFPPNPPPSRRALTTTSCCPTPSAVATPRWFSARDWEQSVRVSGSPAPGRAGSHRKAKGSWCAIFRSARRMCQENSDLHARGRNALGPPPPAGLGRLGRRTRRLSPRRLSHRYLPPKPNNSVDQKGDRGQENGFGAVPMVGCVGGTGKMEPASSASSMFKIGASSRFS